MAKHSKLNLSGMLYLVVHALGVTLCVFALEQFLQNRVLLRLLVERIPLVHLMGGVIPMLILFLLITAAAIFGAGEVVRMLRNSQRGEWIDNAVFRLRIALDVGLGCLYVCVFVLSTPDSFSGPFRLRHQVCHCDRPEWGSRCRPEGICQRSSTCARILSARRRVDWRCAGYLAI